MKWTSFKTAALVVMAFISVSFLLGPNALYLVQSNTEHHNHHATSKNTAKCLRCILFSTPIPTRIVAVLTTLFVLGFIRLERRKVVFPLVINTLEARAPPVVYL